MTVLSVGVTLSHAHAAGDRPHQHGFGWNHLLPGVANVDCDAGPLELHRHLVLLGIELPGSSTPDASIRTVGLVQTSSAVSSDCDRPEYPPDDCTHLGLSSRSGWLAPQPDFDRGFSSPVTYPPLSAVARQAMSGVLRS